MHTRTLMRQTEKNLLRLGISRTSVIAPDIFFSHSFFCSITLTVLQPGNTQQDPVSHFFCTPSCLASLQVPVKFNEYCNLLYWRGIKDAHNIWRGQETEQRIVASVSDLTGLSSHPDLQSCFSSYERLLLP